MSFEQWSQLGKDVHNSMHWAKRNKNKLMLECTEGMQTDSNTDKFEDSHICTTVWDRDIGDEMLRKFRNYEI